MRRYFGKLVQKDVILSDDDIYHILKVMRCKEGDFVEVVCDKHPFLCKITSRKPFKLVVSKKIKEQTELNAKVILICALLKGDKLDFVIQKATELGVSEIILLSTERTIVKLDKTTNRIERYQKIAKEASEQCHRLIIPAIGGVIDLGNLSRIKADVKLIPYEGKAGNTSSFLKEIKKIKSGGTVAVVIGPEGGFAEYEINLAMNAGFIPVSLGRRILRAETAALYATSVISCVLDKE